MAFCMRKRDVSAPARAVSRLEETGVHWVCIALLLALVALACRIATIW
jgi:hypothetical protein